MLKEALDILVTSLAEADNSTADENSDTNGSDDDTGMYSGGVTYKRWGRTECPENATLVYEGSQKLYIFNYGRMLKSKDIRCIYV